MSTANTVVAAMPQDRREQVPDEPVADDQDTSGWHPPRAAKHACERLDHRPARVVDLGSGARPSPARVTRSAKPPGRIVGAANPVHSDSCPRALRARAAGRVVDERDAAAVVRLRHDLVTEHDTGVRRVELLDIRPAQSAGEHADELARPLGLGHLRELRLGRSSTTIARTGVS